MMDQNFGIRIAIFEICKKVSCGPSTAKLDLCDQVSSKSVNVEG